MARMLSSPHAAMVKVPPSARKSRFSPFPDQDESPSSPSHLVDQTPPITYGPPRNSSLSPANS
jgi:hypothetical protein